MEKAKLLIVDDERRMCIVLKTAFENSNYLVTTANSGESALAAMSVETFDVIISDVKMPGISGLELLKKTKEKCPETRVLLMTAYADTQTAVDAMKNGAYDYIIKPFNIDELRHKVANILENRSLRKENQELKQKLKNQFSVGQLVGKSKAMRHVYQLVDKVAQTDASVIIRGESGTGKELIAQAIHEMSPRKDEPFLPVNCSALPENLLESELFGYEKGAFTGADKLKPGLFEAAGGGTIFLDEIGEISLSTQVKLLRVLQSKEVVHLGGSQTIAVHARMIAATNRNLEEAVKDGSFREDFYYRINVFPVFLPALRDKKQDIPDLVAHFLVLQGKNANHIDPKAMDLLIQYHWPGNVRELENIIQRSLIMAGDQQITVSDLPPYLRG